MPRIGEPFIILDSIESTNIYAMHMATAGSVSHGAVFFAIEQSHGKGQRGKSWASEPGSSILMSAVISPEGLEHAFGFPLSCAASLAAAELLENITGEEIRIKWPNDLYWGDRKAGGILIENNLRGKHWQWAVVGIGVNINQTAFSPYLPNPISLSQITGKQYDPIQLARELCLLLEEKTEMLRQHQFPTLLLAYNKILYGKGRNLRFSSETGVFTGTIEHVSAAGSITILRPEEVSYRHGEIEYMLPEMI